MKFWKLLYLMEEEPDKYRKLILVNQKKRLNKEIRRENVKKYIKNIGIFNNKQ
ncbi:hypothetical protein [Peptostreptococcus faecalis]|uniref:hypothetical protein n=1 Tax=Peptostreptococcus faecalis TaxID=2045015 RepID=UPI0015E0F738|nr:hypothetical protein [Peptostreptococcus faecalis]